MTKETTRDPAQKLESKWQKILKEFGKNPRDVQTEAGTRRMFDIHKF